MSNSNLARAKKAKNDEFYTRSEDIEAELSHYDKLVFKNKVVFCNCDDPTSSEFWHYFHLNFCFFKMKTLIATHYNMDGSPSYGMEYGGSLATPQNDIKREVGKKIALKGDGDFRSPECIKLLKESDIVVTNPPFSLFRTYVAQLIKYKKQFLIIGNKNALTYKEIFPLLKNNKIWLGFTSAKAFGTPNGMTKKLNGLTRWFTNIDISKRHQELKTVYRYSKKDKLYPALYPKYDNYDAINVDKVNQIPLDYPGYIGVPITFIDRYNPDQFKIIGSFNANHTTNKKYCYVPSKMTPTIIGHKEKLWNGPVIDKKPKYKRIIIQNKHFLKESDN